MDVELGKMELKSSSSEKVKKQLAARQKIELYFHQLTKGCQNEVCSNPNCASNPMCRQISVDEAAVKAIQLFKEKAKICELESICGVSSSSQSASSSMDYKETSATKTIEANITNVSNEVAMDTSGEAPSELDYTHMQSMDISSPQSPVPAKVQACTSKELDSATNMGGFDVKKVSYLTKQMVDDLLEQNQREDQQTKLDSDTDEKHHQKDPHLPLIRIIGEVFSNVESLNRSFLCAKELQNFEPQEESKKNPTTDAKMEVEPNHKPPESQKLPTPPANSPSEQPLMSLLNSLVNRSSDVDNLFPVGNSPGSSVVIPLASENSGLHRTGAVRKKIHTKKIQMDKKCVSVLQPTVDLDAVRQVYQKLVKIESVEIALVNSLEMLSLQVDIVQQLQREHKFTGTVINLNMFLIIMENPTLHSPEYLEKALPMFCKTLAALPLKAHAVLVKLWSTHDAERLQEMVQTLQQLLTFKLVSLDYGTLNEESIVRSEVYKDEAIRSAVRCLKLLYYASLLGGEVDWHKDEDVSSKSSSGEFGTLSTIIGYEDGDEIDAFGKPAREDPLALEIGLSTLDSIKPLVPISEFENDILNGSFDVYNDFTHYMMDKGALFTFMHYPFILNTVNKTTYLFYDNRIRMLSGRRMMVFQSIFHGSTLSPYLKLKIRRDHVIEDSLVRLEIIAEENPEDLRKQLYVEFEGEQGVDEGGVSKEFFQLVVEQIFNPDYGMFTYNEDTNLFWFNEYSLENKAQFTLIGIVLGLAIYNNCILDIKFPSLVYKKLFGKRARFQDMASSHPVLYSSLMQLLKYDGDVENDMMVTFSMEYSDMFGIVHKHELKEDGVNILVTKENRQEYVDLYSDWLLNNSIKEQFTAFRHGFNLVVSRSPLKLLFRPDELEVLVSGCQEYDFNSLESTTDYDGGFTKNSQTVTDFWAVVHDMTDDDKKKLLQFTTGSDRVPVGGLAQIKLVIARNGPDSERLPTAHTCFNVILLPDYKNRDKLEERLIKAIKYSKGFGML